VHVLIAFWPDLCRRSRLSLLSPHPEEQTQSAPQDEGWELAIVETGIGQDRPGHDAGGYVSCRSRLEGKGIHSAESVSGSPSLAPLAGDDTCPGPTLLRTGEGETLYPSISALFRSLEMTLGHVTPTTEIGCRHSS
jgi:hypothetical protein